MHGNRGVVSPELPALAEEPQEQIVPQERLRLQGQFVVVGPAQVVITDGVGGHGIPAGFGEAGGQAVKAPSSPEVHVHDHDVFKAVEVTGIIHKVQVAVAAMGQDLETAGGKHGQVADRFGEDRDPGILRLPLPEQGRRLIRGIVFKDDNPVIPKKAACFFDAPDRQGQGFRRRSG